MSEYYKSLITDDEVINELIRESKRREGRLPTEATRLKPNLNFFQRTVNNLISNNTRIDKSQDTFKTEYLKDCNIEKTQSAEGQSKDSLSKLNIDYAFERQMVLQTKIDFVKASERFGSSIDINPGQKPRNKIEIKKISFGKGHVGPVSTKEVKNSLLKNSGNKNCKTADVASAISGSRESSNNLILISSDEDSKTTCGSHSIKDKKFKNKRKNLDEACNTSDSIEIISSDSESNRKDKVKIPSKRRKRKSKNRLDEKNKEGKRKGKKRKKKKKDK